MENKVKEIVTSLVVKGGTVGAGQLAMALGVSRQAAHRHLSRLVGEGVLQRVGEGRATRYAPGPQFSRSTRASSESRWDFVGSFSPEGLQEHAVWSQVCERVPALDALSGQSRAAVQYAFTEMVNNAIDHARATKIEIKLACSTERVSFEVVDDGVGVFENLMVQLGLPDERDAIAQLSKGKLTTQRERHTGEGLFFTSRLADRFELHSRGVVWRVDGARDDMAIDTAPVVQGTVVRFAMALPPRISLESLFSIYTSDFEFNKTRTAIKLFDIGEMFISRSEAKRLVLGLERFSEVVLDFKDVTTVGQGFADEVFRVWASAHPETRLLPINMSPAVEFMVTRAMPR